MENFHRIGETLKQKGITKRWLATKVGRSEQTIGSICNGKSQPPLSLLFAIAKALEVSPCDLLDKSMVNKNYIKKSIKVEIAEISGKEKNSIFLLELEELLNDLKGEN